MMDLDDLDLLRFLWVDNANVIRSKAVPLVGPRPALATLERAVRISQAQFALPVQADSVVFAAGLLPEHDVTLVPDWTSLRRMGGGQAAVACDILDGDRPWGHCPRSFLRRMDERAKTAGMEIRVGAELEFTLLRDGAPIDNTAFAQDAAFDLDADVIRDVLHALQRQDLPVAQCHPESGPGQWEISLRHAPVVGAADAIVGARQTIRAVAHRHGMTVNFLPVTSPDGVGSGMHVHVSFTGDPGDGFGQYGGAFMAGVLANQPALLAATAPSLLSLRRFRPHYWAGAFLGWGDDNKEAPLRVVPTGSGAPRDVEYKASDATANPYVLLGCLLAAGLNGLETDAELPPPLVGDPGLLSDAERADLGIEPIPGDPREVLRAFRSSAVFAEAMGELHDSYCAVKQAEHDDLRGLDFEALAKLMMDRV
jgi:glutamine synthetase